MQPKNTRPCKSGVQVPLLAGRGHRWSQRPASAAGSTSSETEGRFLNYGRTGQRLPQPPRPRLRSAALHRLERAAVHYGWTVTGRLPLPALDRPEPPHRSTGIARRPPRKLSKGLSGPLGPRAVQAEPGEGHQHVADVHHVVREPATHGGSGLTLGSGRCPGRRRRRG